MWSGSGWEGLNRRNQRVKRDIINERPRTNKKVLACYRYNFKIENRSRRRRRKISVEKRKVPMSDMTKCINNAFRPRRDMFSLSRQPLVTSIKIRWYLSRKIWGRMQNTFIVVFNTTLTSRLNLWCSTWKSTVHTSSLRADA